MPLPLPPGPSGLPIIGEALHFLRDTLDYANNLPKFGDVVQVPLGRRQLIYLFDPEHIAHVLIHHRKNYPKGSRYDRMRILFGNGLLVSEGEHWRKQRMRMAPSFHTRSIDAFAPPIAEASARAFGALAGGEVAIDETMMALTLEIAVQVLFGTTSGKDAAVVAESFAEMSDFFASAGELLLPLPLWVPTPANRAFRRARDRLEVVVGRIIDERRAGPPGADLLDALLAGQDEQGEGMTDASVRDEVRTLLLAGHETTALALTYAAWLLADAPEVQAWLAEEVCGAPITAAELPRLVRTRQVFQEALRLLPPVPAFLRTPLEDDEIGGFRIPAGCDVILPPYLVQRDARHFPDPERFDPTRWTPEFRDGLPRFAFFPFGGGPRVCIGMGMAMMEGTLALAELARRFSLARAPGATLELLFSITMRPKAPVRLVLTPR